LAKKFLKLQVRKLADLIFFGFGDLLQMWQLADLGFEDPIIVYELKTSTRP
jgi:hypothetical protein